MKAGNPQFSSTGSGTVSVHSSTAEGSGGVGSSASSGRSGAATAPARSDDVHLSELVRSLRSLAGDSPERQAKIEQLARAYADGTYKANAEATAAAMIREAGARFGDERATKRS